MLFPPSFPSFFINNCESTAVVLDSLNPKEGARTPVITTTKKRDFDPTKFLTTIGEGRKIVPVGKKQTIYAQGAACDAVFYIQKGKVGLTVVAKRQRSYDSHI